MQTILVCDDDKEIVEAIDIYLQQEGYQVLKAYDGEEALEILKEKEVHLLIIDVMMPRLDGIRATLKIREESSIPIIILSAKTEDADKILGLNIGADVSEIRELLQRPKYRHAEQKDTAEVHDQRHTRLSKSIEQRHDRRVDAERDCSDRLKPVNLFDHLGKLCIVPGKETCQLV